MERRVQPQRLRPRAGMRTAERYTVLLRDHHLTAVNTHGAAQKPTWTHSRTAGETQANRDTSSRMSSGRSAKKRGPISRPWLPRADIVTTDQYEPMVPAKAVITKTTSTQRPPRRNVDALLQGQKDERYAGVRWSVAVALKKYLDERGGKINDPAGAYNYLEHHMVKSALPHFSQKHESARKNQTPFSGPTLLFCPQLLNMLPQAPLGC